MHNIMYSMAAAKVTPQLVLHFKWSSTYVTSYTFIRLDATEWEEDRMNIIHFMEQIFVFAVFLLFVLDLLIWTCTVKYMCNAHEWPGVETTGGGLLGPSGYVSYLFFSLLYALLCKRFGRSRRYYFLLHAWFGYSSIAERANRANIIGTTLALVTRFGGRCWLITAVAAAAYLIKVKSAQNHHVNVNILVNSYTMCSCAWLKCEL